MTPLEALERIRSHNYHECSKKECLNIIETALKEYEGAKAHIEALNKERIENSIKLKALEIIKECFDLNGFDELVPNSKWFKSKEKQDLLKDVLL